MIVASCLISIAYDSNLYTNLPNKTSSNSECRLIKHELGETCVPLNTQRIVVTYQVALEDIIALGLKPIGVPDTTYVASKSSFLKNKMSGISYIGKEHTFNLEKILELHPDLIISLYGINSANYQLFSKIAPTVQFKYVHARWQTSFRQIGEVLGKTEQAEKLLSEYKQRLIKLKTVLKNQINKLNVSISRFHGGVQLPEFRSQFSFPGSILQEVGISMPDAQRQLIKTPDDTLIILNLERIDSLDADILFVAVDPGARELFQKYQNTRLWQTLNVVQNQRVYSVDSSYWIFGSILSANAIVDDLFKYLRQPK
ncbi:iron-siderophore ABC transporter substrate-binding protein [Anabaena sp. UHCC 0399]|uniref:iron-siderophore ABC transporter substrate-binding protein n=1 Tax=Anabaena sp. UHCC 0399 TaxID=3110238 RepID=UPI002B21D933|nr:iron-siderophore ABC transporter substrate-binding protein [Anabaena sp. UHCC 0399]MEA5569385.1 iron-siderophore ABC transporter substrate-binding protein [Anabaena sp. UHCC 0399]